MKVIIRESEWDKVITIQDGEKILGFNYGGNQDLYCSIINRRTTEDNDTGFEYFTITKENYYLYQLFEELFYDIENINLMADENLPPCFTEEEINEYLIERENRKKGFRLYNFSNYNELYDPNNRVITWYSDETNHQVSNILRIEKGEDIFSLKFYTQSYIYGYDRDDHSIGYIPIRFRNSGSRYDPFNILFMKLYNNMKEIDDVNDFGHQIHIEEYLYSKRKK